MTGLRKDTAKQITRAVGLLENYFLDNEQEPAMLHELAIDFVYTEVMADQRGQRGGGNTSAARFDGRGAIRAAIRKEIAFNEFIKIK